jgi:hypothetical protein
VASSVPHLLTDVALRLQLAIYWRDVFFLVVNDSAFCLKHWSTKERDSSLVVFYHGFLFVINDNSI